MSKLSQQVKKAYGFRFEKITRMKQKHKKANFLGYFKTLKGKKYVIKGMPVGQKRQQFIVKTEQLLAKKGVKLAKPIPAKKNQLFIRHKGMPYVVYEWVGGRNHPLRTTRDLMSAAKTLARFHRASYGLAYPGKVKMYSHSSWIKDYQRRLTSIKKWEKKLMNSKSSTGRHIVKNIPYFYKIGKTALKKLQQSSYRRFASKPYRKQSLVHGDFHNNNIIIRGGQRVLIDFEDVRYDLPSKDLLRLLSIYNQNRKFKGNDFKAMLRVYERFHPLTPALKKILLIDFLFPHIFERDLRKRRYLRVNRKKAIYLMKQEKKKLQFIRSHYFH